MITLLLYEGTLHTSLSWKTVAKDDHSEPHSS